MNMDVIDRPPLSTTIQQLMRTAMVFLLQGQTPEGFWRDYDIRGDDASVGPCSDQWVSGYIGCALLDGASQIDDRELAEQAGHTARHAARWLDSNRIYAAGWGYNAQSGPDADSTAWARLLHKRCGILLAQRDEDFLLEHHRADGGFATYLPGRGTWSTTHPDVSVTVFWALPGSVQQRIEGPLWSSLEAANRSDGLWNAFWWHTVYYHGLNMLLLYLQRHRPVPAVPPLGPASNHLIHGAADLALLAAIDALRHGVSPVTAAMLAGLHRFRHDAGGWIANAHLAVRAIDGRPDDPPVYLFADDNRLMTAAHVLRALAAIEALRKSDSTRRQRES